MNSFNLQFLWRKMANGSSVPPVFTDRDLKQLVLESVKDSIKRNEIPMDSDIAKSYLTGAELALVEVASILCDKRIMKPRRITVEGKDMVCFCFPESG